MDLTGQGQGRLLLSQAAGDQLSGFGRSICLGGMNPALDGTQFARPWRPPYGVVTDSTEGGEGGGCL